MTKRFKCLHIDAAARTVTATDYADYRDLQVMVGGLISVAGRFENGDVLFVDDEGLLKPAEHFFRVDAHGPQPIAGNGVLVGPDVWSDEDEDEVISDVSTSADELLARVTFLSREQARAWARGNASDAATTVYYPDGKGGIKAEVINRVGGLFGVEPGSKS